MKHKKIVVFSHIPKTAGTSLNHLLERHFGSAQLSVIYRDGAVDSAYTLRDLKKDIYIYPKVKLLVGHSLKPYVNFHEFGSRLEWFTFLRDPLKRYISHYIHQQTNNNEMYTMDIHRWSKRFRRQNLMVRMIAGEENLSKAKDNIESKFEFVGLTEYFDDSILMLKTKFEWENFDPRLNYQKMTNRSKDIRDEIIDNYYKYEDCLRENNNLDIELYDYFVKHLWPKQVDSLMPISTDDKNYLSKTQHKSNVRSIKLKRFFFYRPYVYLDNLCKNIKPY